MPPARDQPPPRRPDIAHRPVITGEQPAIQRHLLRALMTIRIIRVIARLVYFTRLAMDSAIPHIVTHTHDNQAKHPLGAESSNNVLVRCKKKFFVIRQKSIHCKSLKNSPANSAGYPSSTFTPQFLVFSILIFLMFLKVLPPAKGDVSYEPKPSNSVQSIFIQIA